MKISLIAKLGRYVLGVCLFCFSASALQAQNTITQFQSKDKATVTSEPAAKKTEIKDAVEFQSNDSLVVDFRNGRKAFLFGAAKVNHDTGQLTAGEIRMNLSISQVEATADSDSDTLSYPVLKRANDEIKSTRILFNYQTQKGKFESARIKVPDGYLIGSKIKNVSEDEVFIEDGMYSTCPPDYLYYYIKAKKMKVVNEEEIFFTNARLYILDIPYPLIFPFGYVPADMEQRTSGLLTPTYAFQAQSSRGIGLQNLGWFQYFSDYITGTFTSDVYTSGSFYLNNRLSYRNTNQFNGSVTVGYSREQGLEKSDPGFGTSVQKSLAVTHSQEFSPYSSMTANINLRTSDYFKRNSYDPNERASTNSSSKLSYQYRHPENTFNFSINSQLSQNFTNNTTSLTGPNSSFRLKTLTPFQNSSSQDPRWYESINLSYSNNFQSRFQFDPIDDDSTEIGFVDALFQPSQYREATGDDDYIQYGFRQTAGLQIGQLLSNPYLNLSGSINYNEYWLPATTRLVYNPDTGKAESSKEVGFAAARDYNAGLGLSTTFYGISNLKIGRLNGFRHTLRPNIGFSYRPDFSSSNYDYYRTVQTDSLGNTRRYSIFQDQIYSGPGAGESRSLTLGLSNVLETKVTSRDSTGEVSEKTIKIIDQFNLNTSYNFAAERFKLANLSTNLRSNIVKGLSINMRADFDFYKRDSLGVRVDELLISDRDRLARMERFSLTASTSFRGGSQGIEPFTPIYRRQYDPFNQARFNPIDPTFNQQIVNPVSSPWSVSFNFSYGWTYRPNQKPDKNAIINANNISFRLTPKWDFRTQIGYDFIEKELTPSTFNLTRSLECWNLSFQIRPFGDFQYYFFSLSLNSSQIQSLFQKLPILKNLERSSSPSGAGRGGFRPSGF